MSASLFYVEARAQLSVLVMSLITLALAVLLPSRETFELIIVAYAGGAIFLGAQSVGHEYSHRTLTMALAQPVGRSQMYIVKFAVLAVMLLILASAAFVAVGPAVSKLPVDQRFTFLGLPVLGAILVAPLMTMVARSVLGGAFMCSFVGGSIWFLLLIQEAWSSGGTVDEVGASAFRNLPIAITALSVVTGVLGWNRFMHLEALEGEVGAISFPRLRRASTERRRQPWRALIGKELHLQQLTLGITLQYVVMLAVLTLVIKSVPSWSSFPIGAITLVYCMILPVIVGAIASAEERQAGTHGWQLLQPVAAWQQWLVKVLVVFAVSAACGIGLPLLLASLLQDRVTFELAGQLATACMFLTCGALYVSSISASAVRAVALALPIGLGLGVLLQTVGRILGPSLVSSASGLMRFGWMAAFTSPAFVAILTPLLLWFGFVNHRSTEQPLSRAIAQGATIAVVAAAALLVI